MCVRRHQYTNNGNGLLRTASESVRSSEAFQCDFLQNSSGLDEMAISRAAVRYAFYNTWMTGYKKKMCRRRNATLTPWEARSKTYRHTFLAPLCARKSMTCLNLQPPKQLFSPLEFAFMFSRKMLCCTRKEGFPAIFQTGPQNQLELGSAGLLVCGCPSHHPSLLEQTRTYVSCDQTKGKEFVISSPHINLDCSARQLDS